MNLRNQLKGLKVLTTDAEKRIGLYAIRYLGRAGAAVTGVARKEGKNIPVGFLSRHIQKKVIFPFNSFQMDLRDFFSENISKYDFINPIDVAQMLTLLDVVQSYPVETNFLLPKRESIIVADNKELLTNYAQSVGLLCPKTYTRIDPADISSLIKEGLTLPCIIKFRGDNRATHWRPEDRYRIVDSVESLNVEYERMHEIESFPIIQEYILGNGYGFFALYDKDRQLKARFCHRRIREFPIKGGPSSCCESIFEPELDSIGRRLLESLEWTGLAMVEFKFDIVRRKFYILEINPRYWGSLPLAVQSGVNFPVLHALSALGFKYPPVLRYKLGRKVRFWKQDIKAIHALVESEKNAYRKIKLILKFFDPSIRDGLIVLDDLFPLFSSFINRR